MSNVKVKATKKPVKPVIVVVYILLVILAVVYLAPLLWMLSVSLKDNAGVMSAPFSLPDVFHFENYQQAWQMGKLGTALVNSVLVCGVTLIISLFFGAMAAFAIARMRWKLSEFMHTFFLIGMMVPVHCVLIPLFVRFAKLGLTNSQGGLMIPYITFSLPMTIFLLTGFFRSMPGEIFSHSFHRYFVCINRVKFSFVSFQMWNNLFFRAGCIYKDRPLFFQSCCYIYSLKK